MRTTVDERFRRHLVGAVVLAALVRLAALAVPVDPMLNPDSVAFLDLARSFHANGQLAYVDQGAPGVLLHAFRSLLYPIFLALLGAGGPAGPGVALFVQGILGAFVVLGMPLLARRAWGPEVGILTAWIGALYWTSIQFERQVTSEALFVPLLVAGALAALHATRAPRLALAGVCFGLAALTRPAGLVAGAALLGIWSVRAMFSGGARPASPRFAGIAAFALALGLVLAPALWRNRIVLGEPVLLTSGGMNFWIGNGRGNVGEAWKVMERDLPSKGEIGMDRWFYHDTWAHARELSASLPALLVEKLRGFATPFTREGWYLPWRFLWPFALAGLLFAWPQDGGARALLSALIGSQVALALLTVAWGRYRYPIEPFLWPFAAAALLRLWRLGRAGRIGAGAIVAGNAGLLALQELR